MPDPVTHLLDTHAWVWLVKGETRAASLKSLPASCVLGVSVISIWEVGMLESKRRLILQPDIQSWVNQALTPLGIQTLPITPEGALLATRLPGQFHGDPADRIIAATAQLLSVPIITADQKIIDYARPGHLKVMAL